MPVAELGLFLLVSLCVAVVVATTSVDRKRVILRMDVVTVGPKAPLAAIRRALAVIEHQPIVPVIGPAGLCGLVDPNLLARITSGGTAAEIMGPPVAVECGTSLRVIRGLMRRYTLPAVPLVAAGGQVVGLFVLQV